MLENRDASLKVALHNHVIMKLSCSKADGRPDPKKKYFSRFFQIYSASHQHCDEVYPDVVPPPSQYFCLPYFIQVSNPTLITPSSAGVIAFYFKVGIEAKSCDFPPLTFSLSLCNHFFSLTQKEVLFCLAPSASSRNRIFTSCVFTLPPLLDPSFYHINKPEASSLVSHIKRRATFLYIRALSLFHSHVSRRTDLFSRSPLPNLPLSPQKEGTWHFEWHCSPVVTNGLSLPSQVSSYWVPFYWNFL